MTTTPIARAHQLAEAIAERVANKQSLGSPSIYNIAREVLAEEFAKDGDPAVESDPKPVDPHADLRARWRPTEKQVRQADALLAVGNGSPVITLHLLTDKTFGIWNAKVGVIALDGVFTDRPTAFLALEAAARAFYEATGRPVTGGFTYHNEPGEWAVFEDIGSVFPRRGAK